jgi:hypothetical protein
LKTNCDVATLTITPPEELAKFGCISERKVENFENSAVIFKPPLLTYCLKMERSYKSLKYGEFGLSFALRP